MLLDQKMKDDFLDFDESLMTAPIGRISTERSYVHSDVRPDMQVF